MRNNLKNGLVALVAAGAVGCAGNHVPVEKRPMPREVEKAGDLVVSYTPEGFSIYKKIKNGYVGYVHDVGIGCDLSFRNGSKLAVYADSDCDSKVDAFVYMPSDGYVSIGRSSFSNKEGLDKTLRAYEEKLGVKRVRTNWLNRWVPFKK